MKQTHVAAALIALAVLGGCGGGGAEVPRPDLAGGVASNPTPAHGVGLAAFDVTPFKQAKSGAACADLRNNLYVIDSTRVLWERVGSCHDNASELVLFERVPDKILCQASMTIAGPREECDSEAKPMFDLVRQHLDEADLGLGKDHFVERYALTGGVTALPTAHTPLPSTGKSESGPVVPENQRAASASVP